MSSPSSNETPTSEKQKVIIAVIGATGTGKTTFINTASGSDLEVGSSLESCTGEVQEAGPFELDDRLVTLIDTPGFDDSRGSDVEVLDMIANFLAKQYAEGKTLAGVVYMHRISDNRMGGVSTRTFNMLRKLCGDNTLRNVVIVTNMWSGVNGKVGEARERELTDNFFKPALDKGARMLRHESADDSTSAHRILPHIIKKEPLPLKIQQELVDEKKLLPDTAAGQELKLGLSQKVAELEKEKEKLKEEVKEAINAKDEETRQELEREFKKREEEIRRNRDEMRKLESRGWMAFGGRLTVELAKIALDAYLNSQRSRDQQALHRQAQEYESRISELQSQAARSNSRGDITPFVAAVGTLIAGPIVPVAAFLSTMF